MNRFSSRMLAGIRFADYVFCNPVPLAQFAFPQRFFGIFVLLVPDPTWGPWHLQPVYFGDFRPDRESDMSAAEQTACLRIAGGKPLYVSAYVLPMEHTLALARMKRELIDRYCPIANWPSSGDAVALTGKLDALEKKIQEHDTLLRLALASVGQMVQPFQEPKRRSVGFQPDPAGSRRAPSETLQYV
jgi:hypothetical protein